MSALREMLLTSQELGNRFVTTTSSEDGSATAVKGCPALDALVGGEATAKALNFSLAHEAEATFESSYSPVELAERLGSDTPARLDAAAAPIDALAQCGKATYVTTRGDIPVTVAKHPANVAGAQGSSYAMTVAGQEIQLTVLRVGAVLMSLSGDPTLVDDLLPAAVAKVAKVAQGG
ncbi:hypothetical protein LO772_33030 [Yinghuangia sp. ASG 101]|uniref:hypothetical protein n=1 Tax=Yinghuangia sp. ASG 101 TaxID=2896848 RepID=UPI001E32465E|nr:hypothetical protein [Yinghuangia sp. ASG 101]UGQ11548.1 hypothetical protein LO772_33030 [Yinghuangia sp. ASG 101]